MPNSHLVPASSLLAVLLVSPAVDAQTVAYAKDGTRAAVQAAVDALKGPGVVVIPEGEFELVGTVSVTADDVTVIGAGAGRTRLFRNAPPAGADAATMATYTAAFLQAKAAARPRFSAMSIRSWKAATGLGDRDLGIACSACQDFRVDHCSFQYTGNSGVTTSGETTGVVDHCDFADIYESPIGNYGYGVSVYGTGVHTGEPFGTSRATFVEDSSFAGCRHAVASNGGARYVFRNNHVTSNVVSHAVDAHGAEYPPSPKPSCSPCYDPDPKNPGTEWVEVYDNVIEKPSYLTAAVRLRGGKGLVYDNTIRDYSLAVSLTKTTPEHTGPVNIWNNQLASGTTLVEGSGTCCGQAPSWTLKAPAGYAPYAHPHPLVADLDVAAGPDMRVMAPAAGADAKAYVDGTGTQAAKGSITAWRWFASPTPISECARDVLELGVGSHVLLLSARRDDGLTEVDTLAVEVLPPGPITSAPGWPDLWFTPLAGTGKLRFEVTPSAAAIDAYVGFTGRHRATAHEDHAMQVRANNQGRFDARNGDTYEAVSQIAYQAGKAHAVEVSFDIAAQTYDVTIDGMPLAKGYAFRRKETLIGQMTAWNASGTGTLKVQGLEVEGTQLGPDPACADPVDAGIADASVADVGSEGGLDAAGQDGAMVADAVVPGLDASEDASLASDSATSATANEDEEGCGCAVPGRRSWSGWTVAALVGVLAMRRRRRD